MGEPSQDASRVDAARILAALREAFERVDDHVAYADRLSADPRLSVNRDVRDRWRAVARELRTSVRALANGQGGPALRREVERRERDLAEAKATLDLLVIRDEEFAVAGGVKRSAHAPGTKNHASTTRGSVRSSSKRRQQNKARESAAPEESTKASPKPKRSQQELAEYRAKIKSLNLPRTRAEGSRSGEGAARSSRNSHWYAARWTEVRGAWHAVTSVGLAFCGVATGSEGVRLPSGVEPCELCDSIVRLAPDRRSYAMPARVVKALEAHERSKARRRGRSSSVYAYGAGLPSMGKRYS